MSSEQGWTSRAAQQHNRRAWDRRADSRQPFARPALDEEFADPLHAVDRLGWLGGDIAHKKLLCLAAGGGRQGPLYAAAGADVTVVDISAGMLELDRRVAAERGLEMRLVQSSMDDLSMLAEGEFEIVIHPVSTCYVPDLTAVYREVARVCRSHGLYISQHKQPASLQADMQPTPHGYELVLPYYRRGPLPEVQQSVHREDGTLEYLHRWEQLVGGMCRAGFVVEDLVEPPHCDAHARPGSFGHRSRYVAPYVRFRARRVTARKSRQAEGGLWTPKGFHGPSSDGPGGPIGSRPVG
jgi:SAM-dependent methyltransferase